MFWNGMTRGVLKKYTQYEKENDPPLLEKWKKDSKKRVKSSSNNTARASASSWLTLLMIAEKKVPRPCNTLCSHDLCGRAMRGIGVVIVVNIGSVASLYSE